MDHAIWLKKAILQARVAEKKDEVPVGAVVVFENKIIGRGHNRRETDRDPLGHAELYAIKSAAKKLGTWRLQQCDLYVTLEPCPMCAAALSQSRIRSVYYGAEDPKGGAFSLGFNLNSHPKLNHRYTKTFLPTAECSLMLTHFFKKKRLEKKQNQDLRVLK